MKRVIRKFKKLWYTYTGNEEGILALKIQQFREAGGVCGDNFKFYCGIPGEPCFVTIGENVTIANGAILLTHDNSVIKCNLDATDYFGRITIGDSCFVGMNSILLPGVELGDHTIVGAGSVVTKSFPKGNVVIAGNPARPICTIEEFRSKKQHLCVNLDVGDRRQHKREYLSSLPEDMLEKK